MAYQSRTDAFGPQQRALAKIISKKGGALLGKPGSGKTKVAIDFCGRLWTEGKLERVLVICPASVLGVWETEITKHLGIMVPYKIIRLRGSLPKRIKQVREYSLAPKVNKTQTAMPPLVFILVNYEAFWRKGMLEALEGYRPQSVIADESHRLKNPNSRQSKGMKKFVGCKFPVIMTGTLIAKTPLDVFGQWRFLNPERFGNSWWSFRYRYAVFGGYLNKEIIRYMNLDDLERKVREDGYIFAQRLGIPDPMYQIIPIELNPATWRIYKPMAKEYATEIAGKTVTAPIALTKALRLSQITGGFLADNDGVVHQVGGEKLAVMRELLDNYTYPDRKVVVFARFLPEIEAIVRIASSLGLNPVKFVGAVIPEQRDKLITKFQTDPGCQVFVAQIATGGVGITLTAAQTAIFYSLDYNLVNYVQACARIWRIGQTGQVLYLHLLAKGSIDEVVYEALEKKEDVAKKIVDYLKGAY